MKQGLRCVPTSFIYNNKWSPRGSSVAKNVLSKIICWNHNAQCDVIYRWSLYKGIRSDHKAGLHDAVSTLINSFISLPLHVKAEQKGNFYKPWKEPSSEQKHAVPLNMDLPTSRTEKKIISAYLRHPVNGISIGNY